MISVRNNIPTLISSRYIGIANDAVKKSLAKLSTGKRINSAADDPAGLAISNRLKTQIDGMEQAKNNTLQGISLLSTAEGGTYQITSALHRLNSLAIEASNGTLTYTDRALIQNEVDQLVSEVDRLSSVTTFNGIQLLKGSTVVGTGSIQIQAGYESGSKISINLATTTTASLGISGLSVAGTDTAAAESAITLIQTAIGTVAQNESKIGALQNRMNYAADFLDTQRINTSSALSVIEDTDFATELTNYTQNTMLVQSATSVMAQSNAVSKEVLTLLGIG